jgi:23S rRNA pseudouridine1911/1915/1917 synthase
VQRNGDSQPISASHSGQSKIRSSKSEAVLIPPTEFRFSKSEAVPQRLDHFLQAHLSEYSRSRIQSWIKDGHVLVNGASAKASLVLRGGERIQVSPAGLPPLKATPEDLPVDVLYEDASLIAVNKPAGLVVHAGAGVHAGTLVNRLVHRFATLSQLGGEMRPGIVHRLDKDTSGVLLVARTDAAHRALAAQFAGRTVEKIYLALVHGKVRADSGRITRPIARDPVRRTRMTARLESGREALTEYRVRQRFEKFTYLEVRIGTGRTHQIRVHLASIGHPVAGDRTYGAPEAQRLFLHAWRIGFISPTTGEKVAVEAPLPQALEAWLAGL